MATIHHRSRCEQCRAELLHLVGDPTVPYEDIDPIEGGPPALIEHTTERCQFHQFLSPPGGDGLLTAQAAARSRPLRFERWVRRDVD